MSFVRRKIDLTFQLGTGNFGTDGYNTVKVTGLRVRADLSGATGPGMLLATVRVYGLTLPVMNQLAPVAVVVNGKTEIRKNTLLLEAGDDGTILSRIFQGQITLASIDMSAIPDSSLVVTAIAGAFEKVAVAKPTTYPGTADVALIMQTLATQMHYDFKNNGVSVILSKPYFYGTLVDQMNAAAVAANIEVKIDNGVLAIWPKGGSREGEIPLISSETGMVGYPINWQIGARIKTMFNPQLRIGSKVQIKSQLAFANGIFNAYEITHALESELPSGDWFTSFHAQPINAA